MELKKGVYIGIALIIVFIFLFTIFDVTEKVSVIRVKVEVIEFEGKTEILESSAEQSKISRMKRPSNELDDFPAIASHALINGSYYSAWGTTSYKGPGEYDLLIGFFDRKYPQKNETIMLNTYIYDIDGKSVSKNSISLQWQ